MTKADMTPVVKQVCHEEIVGYTPNETIDDAGNLVTTTGFEEYELDPEDFVLPPGYALEPRTDGGFNIIGPGGTPGGNTSVPPATPEMDAEVPIAPGWMILIAGIVALLCYVKNDRKLI